MRHLLLALLLCTHVCSLIGHPVERDDNVRQGDSSTIRSYHGYISPLVLIQNDFKAIDLGVEARLFQFVTGGVSTFTTFADNISEDRLRVMTYAEVYVSGDAFSNSLVVSPALALRRMHATRLTPEMTRLGVGAFVGYKYFYGEPQNDAISVALMLGGVNYWPIDHLNVYQSSSTINVYARLAIGYVLSTRNR